MKNKYILLVILDSLNLILSITRMVQEQKKMVKLNGKNKDF